MEGLLGEAATEVIRAMRFRVARQGLLAANLANVDTPGYRRADLEFGEALDRALVRSHPAHRAGSRAEGGHRLVTGPKSDRPDGNGVELEPEIIAAVRNAGAFTDQAEVLARLFRLARVAVSGEPR